MSSINFITLCTTNTQELKFYAFMRDFFYRKAMTTYFCVDNLVSGVHNTTSLKDTYRVKIWQCKFCGWLFQEKLLGRIKCNTSIQCKLSRTKINASCKYTKVVSTNTIAVCLTRNQNRRNMKCTNSKHQKFTSDNTCMSVIFDKSKKSVIY